MKWWWKKHAADQNRTDDTGIFSPLLYRLSYSGIHIREATAYQVPHCLSTNLGGGILGGDIAGILGGDIAGILGGYRADEWLRLLCSLCQPRCAGTLVGVAGEGIVTELQCITLKPYGCMVTSDRILIKTERKGRSVLHIILPSVII